MAHYYQTFYGNYDKENFIKRCRLELATARVLDNAWNTAMEVVEKMHGKVANVKVQKAVQEALDGAGVEARTHWSKEEDWRGVRYELRFTPKNRCDGSIYTDNFLVMRILVDDDFRVDFPATKGEDCNSRHSETQERFVRDHEDAIGNYDAYIAMTETLRSQIEQYRRECNYLLRATTSIPY